MPPEYLVAIVLGVIQGIAEFLPISSSGHIVIFQGPLQEWFGVGPEQLDGLELNVALHLGTLFSIVVVYWSDLVGLLRQPRVILAIVLASIPTAIIGFAFKDLFEEIFATPKYAGGALLVTALLLLVGQKFQREDAFELEKAPTWLAPVVGLIQGMAIVPGISRSGSTIAAGLCCGLDRNAAAKFSFLIAIPAIGGATLLTAKDIVEVGSTSASVLPLLIGAVVAFVTGLVALKFLLRVVARGKLHWFSAYCVCVGLIVLAM